MLTIHYVQSTDPGPQMTNLAGHVTSLGLRSMDPGFQDLISVLRYGCQSVVGICGPSGLVLSVVGCMC